MHLLILAAGQGTRLRSLTGPHPKLFLEVGGQTLLDRFLGIAALLNLSPLVVTRPEYEADFRRAGVETLVEDSPYHPLGSLYYARRVLSETFCWIGGDMLFSDPEPLRELLAEHLAGGYVVSSPYCRRDRFRARLRLSPEPKVVITPEPGYPLSIPNFLVNEPKVFSYMMPEPHGEFL
jgi:choline kinase